MKKDYLYYALLFILIITLGYLGYLVLNNDNKPNNQKVDINLMGNTLIMGVGNSYQIEYVGNYEKAKVIYASSDPSVLMVDENGVIKALKEGNAYVDLSINGFSSGTLLVYVIEDNIETKYITLPTNIEIEDNIKVKSGDEFVINYQLLPREADNNLVKISSDSEIIEINKNKVKALKSGNATITLETINGLKKYLNVLVEEKEIKVTALKITNPSIQIGLNVDTKLPYEIVPSDATNQEVLITSSNNNVLVNSDGTIRGVVNKSESVITISTKDGGYVGQVNVSVRTGIDDPSIKEDKNGVNKACNSSNASDTTFNSCFKNSHHLSLSGVSSGSISMKVGETKSIRVNLPSECGSLVRWTRRSSDGQSNWIEFVTQSFGGADNSGYTWIITAKKQGSVILSQTVQYDSKAPSGTCVGNVKSMVTLTVNIR